MSYNDFGDDDPEDAIAVGDEDVDWSQVESLADAYDAVLEIEDEDSRLAAAMIVTEGLND